MSPAKAVAVDACERFVEPRLRIETRRGDVEPAERTDEAVERQRPFDIRVARDDTHGDISAEVERSAAAGDQARADYRRVPGKAAAQLAVPLERKADRTERRRKRNAAVGDVEDELG